MTLLVLITSLGCSESADIQLRDPMRSVESQVPGSAGDGPVTSPKDPVPDTEPTEPLPKPVLYRVFCEDRYPPYLTAISSMASPLGFGAGIEMTEVGATTSNLQDHGSPLVVALPQFGLARVLFSARREYRDSYDMSKPRFLFIADADITARSGAAKFVANEVPVSSAVRSAADKESLTVRTFGVSDGGRYLLIGQSNGYRILDSASLAFVALLQVGNADSNVNPSLRESDMVFSVARTNGNSFTSTLYSVQLGPRGGVKALKPISTISSLRRPLVPIGNSAGESFASLDSSDRIAVVSAVNPGQITRSVIANIPTKGRLASSSAFWRDPASGGLRAAIVFENIVPLSGSGFIRYKIEQVFIRAVSVDEVKLSADPITIDFDFPGEVRSTIESGIGVSVALPGVRDLRTTSDGLAVFGLFPGSLSTQLYRFTSAGLVRVSQDTCGGFSIGREL